MNLYYIANHQLPTTKAHGLQIMKMCESFCANGINCELIIPQRNIDPEISERDPFKFYGINKIFKITHLRSFDFIQWGLRPFGKILFWLQQLSFGYSVRKYLKDKEGVVYSRDQFSLYALLNTKHKLFWEAHNFPKNISSVLYKNILKKINGLVVISLGLKNKFSEVYPKEILLAADAVDLNQFDINMTREEARTVLGLPSDKKIAMYVGQLYKWKGVDVLASSAKFLAENELIVIVGGQEEDREMVRSYIDKGYEDKIMFIDYVSNNKIPTYLKSADCLVLTGKNSEAISRQYTSPLKLFEYMASKRPIVSQSLPSFQEILNYDNAVLVEPEDPEKLAEGMKKAFYDRNLTEKITQSAFENVRSRTWGQRAQIIKNYIQ